jgi:hypothetical protein
MALRQRHARTGSTSEIDCRVSGARSLPPFQGL